MKKVIAKIKNSKIVNTGVIKKLKDFIYFKIVSPNNEKKTDKYRKEILALFADICKDCKWQLIGGAFLRYYRDNTMDGQDFDFYVDEEDFDKVKDKFFNKGFSLKQYFMDNNDSITEYKYLYKNVEVDVFIMKKNKKGIYSHKFTLENNNAKKIERKMKGNIQIITGKDYCSFERMSYEFPNSKEYEYKGVIFKAAKNPDKMLSDMYGKTWRVYDPNYDSKTSPKNNMPIITENATTVVYIEPVKYYDLYQFKNI